MTSSPLAEARRDLLDALTRSAEDLDDAGIARLCGVSDAAVPEHRARLARLTTAPTLPAYARYTGVVHRFAGLGRLDPDDAGVEVGVLTGLLGVATLAEPVPDYRLEVTGRAPGLGVLATWWRHHLGQHLRALAGRRRVWDLLPGEFSRMWPPRERGGVQVTTVRFERPDRRAAPSASAKVAKGRLLAELLAHPGTTPRRLVGSEVVEGWEVLPDDGGLRFVLR